MNINAISEYNTAISSESITQAKEKKTEEAKGTQTAQTKELGAVYTEGDSTGCESTNITAVNDAENENSDEDSVYKKEEDKTEKDLSKASGQITEEDYKAMTEEGMTIEKFELERTLRMLARVKEQRTFQDESITDQKVKLAESIKAQQNIAVNYSQNKALVNRLEAANIPVTKANLFRISSAEDKAASAADMSDQAKYYLIKNRMEPTIDNIYKASYSGAGTKEVTVNENQWESVRPQAENIIEEAGFTVNEETLGNAKWLFGRGLGITENNLWASWDLNKISTDLNKEDITEKAITALSKGDTASPSLSFLAQGQTTQAVDNLNKISDAAIKAAVIDRTAKEAESLSIRELVKKQSRLEDPGLKGTEEASTAKQAESSPVTGNSAEEIDIRTVTVRRRLEEIRLKMTADAGGELIKRGFHLETDSLQKLVDGLKEIEDKYYRNLLQEGNVSTDEENVNSVKKSLQQLDELKSAPAALLGSTLHTWQQETTESLLSSANDYKKNLAVQNYETLMTRPRTDMGDSIAKAFGNSDGLLEEIGLENTEANKRALRILGYNNIPITEENLDTVKLHDAQVNNVMKNFHPAVAVEFIKRGINPVNLPIDELSSQIDSVKEELGVSKEERFSKYLWKLEKNNEINEEEKKSYIGIYRLFNAIEKSDGAALGAVVKADQDLTLKNLLTAVRTRKSGGIEAAVDDELGTLGSLTAKGDSITDQINAAYGQKAVIDSHSNETETAAAEEDSQITERKSVTAQLNESQPDTPLPADNKTAYIRELLKALGESLSPEGVKSLGGAKALENMPLEQLTEEMEGQPKALEEEYYREQLNNIKDIAATGREAESLLRKENLPVTITNIMAASDYLQKDNTTFQKLNGLLNNKEILPGAQKSNAAESTESVKDDSTPIIDKASDNSEETTVSLESISDRLLGSMDSTDSITAAYEELETNVQELLQNYYEKGSLTSKDISELKRISNGMQFISEMAAKKSYQIPLATAEGVTNVNVTLLKNSGDAGKADIRISSAQFGQIGLKLSVKNNETSAFIVCETREGLNAMKGNESKLTEAFLTEDTKIKQINYSIGNNLSETGRYNNYKAKDEEENNKAGGTDTATLLKFAKVFILQIKELETKG